MTITEVIGTYGHGETRALRAEYRQRKPRSDKGGIVLYPFRDLPEQERNRLLKAWKRCGLSS